MEDFSMDPRHFDPLGMSSSFVHRRLLGAAKGLIKSGGSPLGALAGFAGGGGSEGRSGSAVIPKGKDPIPGLFVGQGPDTRTAVVPTCAQRGMVIDRAGRCVNRAGISGLGPGAGLLDPLGLDLGAAVTGLFVDQTTPAVPMIGASATAPFRVTQVVRRCGRGNVLATDGLCYDRKLLRKDQRMWPPGRKPLLTGGDLNAISRAARAAGRMKTQQKRLQKLGLLPKPKSTRRAPAPVSHHHD